MANVRYGMNLRYANMWDMPLRYFAALTLTRTSGFFGPRAAWALGFLIVAVCLLELNQYFIFFVHHDLYELVTAGLLQAINVLK